MPVTSGARVAVARALLRLPEPVRDCIYQVSAGADRARRRRLEARGDYSRSAPALYDMDAKLEQYLAGTSPRVFVEAGANDGYHQSNTYRLERVHGWRGILVEPVPSLFEEARRERPNATAVNCALVDQAYDQPSVRLVYGGMMTTVAGARGSIADDRAWVAGAHAVVQARPEHEFEAPARTMSSILDEHGVSEVGFRRSTWRASRFRRSVVWT